MNQQPKKSRRQVRQQEIDAYNAEQDAHFTTKFPQLAPNKPSRSQPNFTLIGLGVDDANRLIAIDELPRLEHMHAIGATGAGKSTFLLNCILQDIARGRGVAVLDPHGAHPGSVLNNVLHYLYQHGFPASKIHIISPNVRDYIVGFNPLAPLPGTDSSVIADAMVKAFERAWNDENTLEKPLTRRLLRVVFTALAQCRMTIPDAADLLAYEDRDEVRKHVIDTVQDATIKRELEDIERLSKEPRSFESFKTNVLGPVNRLEEFIANPTMRLMLGMSRDQEQDPDNTIDLLDIMEKGHILLVDLQHGPAVSEAVTDLLGKLLLRYLFLLMGYRKNLEPYFVYVDESHRFMTDDVQSLLTDARKYRIGVSLAHQFLAQLGKPDDAIYQAVLNSTQVKTVFRINSAKEAQLLAEEVIPLDLEMPVLKSIAPRVVGHHIGHLQGDNYTVSEGEGESYANIAAHAVARGRTFMQTWAHMHGRTTGNARSRGAGSMTGAGSSAGTSSVHGHSDSMALSYDPNTGTFMSGPTLSTVNIGSGDTSAVANIAANSFLSADSQSEATTTSEAITNADSEGGGIAESVVTSSSQAEARGTNRNRNVAQGRSSSEAIIPDYKDLPGSFHSLDNVRYMMGERIRDLPTGRAVLKFRGKTTFITIPPPRPIAKP